MSVQVLRGGTAEAADVRAAKALAVVMAGEESADMAVAVSPRGGVTVMRYAVWEASCKTGGSRSDWDLLGVAWKSSGTGR